MEGHNVDNMMGVGAAAAGDVLTRQVVVVNQLGLHARPAGVLAQEAQGFHASIELVLEDQTVDAKSILDILTLAAGQGVKLEVRAGGDDARAALDRLEHLFKTRFGEDK